MIQNIFQYFVENRKLFVCFPYKGFNLKKEGDALSFHICQAYFILGRFFFILHFTVQASKLT